MEYFAELKKAISESNPVLGNLMITRMHYVLGQELNRCIGRDSGANFHNWATWGSKKAGFTIRQNDLDSAIRNALWISGIAGALVGVGAAFLINNFLFSQIRGGLVLLGGALGALIGGATGRLIAVDSRQRASKLILEGNRIVLDDIGGKTLDYIQSTKSGPDKFTTFIAGFRPGPSGEGGQKLLIKAFEAYDLARMAGDEKTRQLQTYRGNCYAILHEHIRLQPYIKFSMPWIIRRCVTERMMSYEVGGEILSVSDEVPSTRPLFSLDEAYDKDFLSQVLAATGQHIVAPASTGVAAKDWTRIDERMNYIFRLFLLWHSKDNVRLKPYGDEALEAIGNATVPNCPL